MASSPRTIHCEPNDSAPSFIRVGFSTAAVFIDILSAPARNIWCMSSIVRNPPPTVNGINTCSATFETILAMIFLLSDDAVMS